LQKQDFRIFENGEPQRIDRFTPNEAPFNLMLLLDVSGSTKGYMDLIKDASVEFTRMIGTQDHIALATFNSRTHLELDFTNNRNRVEREIRRIKSGGGTAFYDALDRCITRFMRDLEGRKAIVVFTDGVDNQLTGDYSNGSEITFRELYRQIQEEDTLIYTIFLDTEDEHGRVSSQRNPGTLGGILSDIILGKGGSGRTNPPRGGGGGDPAYAEARRELELIADQTGGRMYSPRDIYDLSNVYSEIADDLRIQYTLGYHSTNPHHDGQWREIDVKIVNRPELAVRARKGYYSDQFQP
jgi:VWFA-related protein